MRHRTDSLIGVPVDRISALELRTWVRRCLASSRAHRIITLNPEIALMARRNPRYGAIIRTADLITVDGIGIALVLRFLGRSMPERITGLTVLEMVCATAAEEHAPVVFLLRHDGLTAPPLLRARLHERWPDLAVAIATVDPRQPMDDALRRAVLEHAPRVLLTNFGHPIQEQWIAEHVDAFPTVRIAAGVGGAVDYCSGAVPLPPLRIRRYGLEWAWRLIRQPRRYRRIADAVIRFPLSLITRTIDARLRTTAVRPSRLNDPWGRLQKCHSEPQRGISHHPK